MNIFPMFDNVHLTEDAKSGTTVSGIYLEGNGGNTQTYTVVGIGGDVKRIQVGNKVILKLDTTCFIIKIDGKQSVIVSEDKIVAVVS